MKTRELVYNAVNRKLGLPEIQRDQVWAPGKLRNFADSLYLGWPVGSMVLWHPPTGVDVVDRNANYNAHAAKWVLDGQQRTTALCVLFGQLPYWLDGAPNQKVQFHPLTEKFKIAPADTPSVSTEEHPPRSRSRPPVWVDVAKVIGGADDGVVRQIALNLSVSDHDRTRAMETLQRLRQIRERDIPTETVDINLEEVSEVFRRINQEGTRISQADVTLAVATASAASWRSREVEPFMRELAHDGFDITASTLLQSLTAVWKGNPRFGLVATDEWAAANDKGSDLNRSWIEACRAWRSVLSYLRHYGITSLAQLPSKSPLVTLVTVRARHKDALNDGKALDWLLKALLARRYQHATQTKLTAEAAVVHESGSAQEAFTRLMQLTGYDETCDVTAGRLLEPRTSPEAPTLRLLM